MNNETIEGEILPKNKGGRPLKYKTAKSMQVIIDQYFDDVERNREAVRTNQPLPKDTITDTYHPTVTGLALVLDLDRKKLIEYNERDKFSNTIKAARDRIQSYLEARLYESSPAGAIFNLKNNYGWRDEKHLSLENNEIRTIMIITGPDSALTKRLEQTDTDTDTGT